MIGKIFVLIGLLIGLIPTFYISKWTIFRYKYDSTLDCPLGFIKYPIFYWLFAILIIFIMIFIVGYDFWRILSVLICHGVSAKLGTYFAKMKFTHNFYEHYVSEEGLEHEEAMNKAIDFVNKYY